MKTWPGPIVALFLGQSTQAQAEAAAEDPELETKRRRVCEANFYGGELALIQGSKDEAARRFHAVAKDCPKTLDEREAASMELKSLGASK